MRVNFKLALVVLTVSILSCKSKHDVRLTINNNAEFQILVMLSTSFPDTQNYVLSGCSPKDPTYLYNPKESKDFFLFGQTWESFLNELDSKTAMLLIYNADSAGADYDKTGDCSLLIGKELKRIDVTMDYLNNNNFTIAYP